MNPVDGYSMFPAWLLDQKMEVQLGPVPKHLPNPIGSGVLWQASHDAFLMEIPDAARLLVTSQKLTLSLTADISLQCLEPILRRMPLAVLCWFRGIFARKGVALAGPDGAVVILGATVTGKSSLAAILMKRGLALLCDDLVPLFMTNDGRVQVLPVWPEIVLWPDAIKHIFPQAPPPWLLRREGDHFHVPYWSVDPVRYRGVASDLKAIYCLRMARERDEPTTKATSGIEGLVFGALVPYHGAIGAALGTQSMALKFHSAISARMPFQVLGLPLSDLRELDGIAEDILVHCGWGGYG